MLNETRTLIMQSQAEIARALKSLTVATQAGLSDEIVKSHLESAASCSKASLRLSARAACALTAPVEDRGYDKTRAKKMIDDTIDVAAIEELLLDDESRFMLHVDHSRMTTKTFRESE